MYSVRLFSVRRARYMEALYNAFEGTLLRLAPLVKRIGYDRLERPVAAVERGLKGLLFDCQMCGQCALSSTGMSCSMNCPKNLRNGPCGGVRPNGNCEVKPEMKCVWVQAWDGAKRMQSGMAPWPGTTTRSAARIAPGSAVTRTRSSGATCSSALETDLRLPMP